MLGAFAPAAGAQSTWPNKPVRIISPFPPGGSVDQVARILAAQLTVQTGQQFIVENRTGASGAIGTQAVATAPGDGYTWGVVFDTHAVNPSLMPSLAFDTTKDIASVMLIGTAPNVIVAHPGVAAKDFREVIAKLKARENLPIGSIGSGSLGHLAVAQIGNLQGVEFNHIPYKGGGPLMIDAIGGQVPLAIGSMFLTSPHVKAAR
jgi:tripartite-type tricarboxylate transporter receptor subunit TctC